MYNLDFTSFFDNVSIGNDVKLNYDYIKGYCFWQKP